MYIYSSLNGQLPELTKMENAWPTEGLRRIPKRYKVQNTVCRMIKKKGLKRQRSYVCVYVSVT